MNREKAMPKREAITRQIEENTIRYMKEGDHCNQESPVLKTSSSVVFI
jgi:hypothetical protein